MNYDRRADEILALLNDAIDSDDEERIRFLADELDELTESAIADRQYELIRSIIAG